MNTEQELMRLGRGIKPLKGSHMVRFESGGARDR
jgi:hypothetical protein